MADELDDDVGVMVPHQFPRYGNTIPKETFVDSSIITAVTFHAGLLVIEDFCFRHCINLESVTFPAKLQRIGKGAFASCARLRKVVFPATTQLVSIGSVAFRGCIMLSSFIHPPTMKTQLKSFDRNMFQGCTNLAQEVKEGWEVHLTPEDFEHFGSIIPRNSFLGRTEIA